VAVGNEWGSLLDLAARRPPDGLLILGHPGKLAKLPLGFWDTHSSRSASPVPSVIELGGRILERELSDSTTVEGVFAALSADEQTRLGDALAETVRSAVRQRLGDGIPVAAVLINLAGEKLGNSGDLTPWR
jgi:cobalt-precorrin-5B (C1)-methyltransferase